MRRKWMGSAVVALAVIVTSVWAFAGHAGVMESPTKPPAITGPAFPYDDLAGVLSRYVDGEGQVDYAGLKKARAPLDRFVALLSVAGPEKTPKWFPTREHKLAYYVNAYNALTLFQVVERLPDFTNPYDNKVTFWGTTRFLLDGKLTSLHALENDLIRPTFKEPRVHFALNCASAGCPMLPREPFTPQKLEAQLARETIRFLGQKRNVDVKDGVLVLTQIFEWYGEDFPGGPEAWVRARRKALPATKSVSFRPYDWALNEQRKPKP